MNAQMVFMVLGFVLLAVFVAFAVAAVLCFVRKDIRAVLDDLSGKSRQREIGEQREKARVSSQTAVRGKGRSRDSGRQNGKAGQSASGTAPSASAGNHASAGSEMRPDASRAPADRAFTGAPDTSGRFGFSIVKSELSVGCADALKRLRDFEDKEETGSRHVR